MTMLRGAQRVKKRCEGVMEISPHHKATRRCAPRWGHVSEKLDIGLLWRFGLRLEVSAGTLLTSSCSSPCKPDPVEMYVKAEGQIYYLMTTGMVEDSEGNR